MHEFAWGGYSCMVIGKHENFLAVGKRHTCRLRVPDTPNPKSDADRSVCVHSFNRPTVGSEKSLQL